MKFSTIVIALSLLWLTHAAAESSDNGDNDKKDEWNVSQPAFSVDSKAVVDLRKLGFHNPDSKVLPYDSNAARKYVHIKPSNEDVEK